MAISFREYIEEKYMDIIFYKLKDYICDNKTKISFKLNRIDDVHEVWLEEAYFEHFYVHDYKNDNIGITIILETNVILKQHSHGDVILDYDHPWFLVKCKCKLSDKLTDFKIQNIEAYDRLDKEEFGLTDNLIPYIKKEKMDEIASEILNNVYPEALDGSSVNSYKFAKRLGLIVIKTKFKNPSIMGKIYFADHKSIKSDGTNKLIKANTIRIDKNANYMGYENSINYTIMHECVHFILHKKAFQLERLFNKKANTIECLVDGSANTQAQTTPIDWMEWQANTLASRLLMPVEPFKKKVSELFDLYKLTYETNDNLLYYEQIMYDLSKFYKVSVEAVKIRLVELGYEFPLGCFITIDGKSIPPHTFSKGSLSKNETFAISDADAALYSFTEKYINNNNLIDGYIYVDSHLCINHPKYIFVNEFGRLTLTNYARNHMDECCIKFEIDIPKKIGNQKMNYKTFKILNRKKGNHSELVVKAYKSFDISANKNNKEKLEEAFQKVEELYIKIPRSTNGLFKILKEYSGFTNIELQNISGLSKDTIDAYLYKDNHTYTRSVVIRLLLTMNIPPQVSKIVLELCRCDIFPSDKENQWIDYVLRNRWLYSLDENLRFLQDKNIYI